MRERIKVVELTTDRSPSAVGLPRRLANRTEAWFDAVAGSRAVSRLGVTLTRHRLRVLAYHGISDEVRFSQQMEILRRDFQPVGAGQVLDALEGRSRLPERAVWITFDDADPSIIDVALPLLARYELPSTMFVCPAVVDTDLPYWWQVVERFAAEALPYPSALPVANEAQALKRLKSMSDTNRRSVTDEMTSAMADAGISLRHRQISSQGLRRYIELGGTLGNHSWDHPCLNRCSPDEQRRQVARAHDWLQARFPPQPLVFAYPNGDWAPEAEAALSDLGYRTAVFFDHRLADLRRQPPLQLSRLRTNSELTIDRYRAILGGVHPLVQRTLKVFRAS